MARKHRSPAIHIILQKREGIDCVGKQSWEVEEKGEKRSMGPFHAVHAVCAAIGLALVESASSPHRPATAGRRKAREKTGLLIQCRVIFLPGGRAAD